MGAHIIPRHLPGVLLRVLIIGAGGHHRTEASILRAIRSLGHDGRLIDVLAWDRRLGATGRAAARRLATRYRPDAVILTRHAHRLGGEFVERLMEGRVGGFWYFDFAPALPPAVMMLARAAGTLYLTCRSQVEVYRAAGVPRVRFLPQGVDPDLDTPIAAAPPEFHCDLAFVGSGQYRYRHELLQRLAAVGTLHIRGQYWDATGGLPVVGGPVHGRRFAAVVRGAAISVGAHASAQQACQEACASNRMWKVMGCGGLFLGPWMPGIDEFARHGEHCLWYENTDRAVSLAREYLARPDQRAALAAAGRAHALSEHTYAHRVRLLLDDRGWS